MKLPLKLIASAVLAVLFSGTLAGEAHAGYLLGVTYYDNQLIQVDPTTGIGTLVGNLSSNVSAFGLAQRSGSLYTYDSTLGEVAQIDPRSGSTIEDINVGIGAVLGQGGLAFRGDGIGFLTTALDPKTTNPANDLYSFDITTGKSTLISTHPSGPTLAGLAFVGNTLYGLGKLDNTLYTIDQATGVATIVGSLGYSAGSPFESLSSGPGGALFATLDDFLFSINPTTGAATPLDPTFQNDTGFSSISGLSYAATVPEPSSFVLVAIGLVSGLVARNRRRAGR